MNQDWKKVRPSQRWCISVHRHTAFANYIELYTISYLCELKYRINAIINQYSNLFWKWMVNGWHLF